MTERSENSRGDKKGINKRSDDKQIKAMLDIRFFGVVIGL